MRTRNGETIGARIAQIRDGKTRTEFAKVMGVHKNTLARYEDGDTSINAEFIAKLAAQGFNAQWILTGEGEMRLEPEHVAAHADMVSDVLEGDPVAAQRREAAIQAIGHKLRSISDRITNILGAAGIDLSQTQREMLEAEVHEIVRESRPDPAVVPPPSSVVDELLLAQMVQRLEELIEEAGEEWTPAARARLIARAYREEKEDEALDAKERQAIGRIRATQSGEVNS